MKIVIIYISPNGTTGILAKLLKDNFESNGHLVESVNLGSSECRNLTENVFEKLINADIAGFGSPVYHMDILQPMKSFIMRFAAFCKINNHQLRAFIFLNYGGITSGKAFINTAVILINCGIKIIGGLKINAPHFHHTEKFPANDSLSIIETFCSSLQTNNFAEMKLARIKKIFSPEKFIVRIIFPIVHIIGKFRKLPITVVGEKCKKCGKCVIECPVGAIEITNFLKINKDKCISCYHCVSCPFKAIEIPIEKLEAMIKFNKKIIGTENPLNKILI